MSEQNEPNIEEVKTVELTGRDIEQILSAMSTAVEQLAMTEEEFDALDKKLRK